MQYAYVVFSLISGNKLFYVLLGTAKYNQYYEQNLYNDFTLSPSSTNCSVILGICKYVCINTK